MFAWFNNKFTNILNYLILEFINIRININFDFNITKIFLKIKF